MYYIRCSERLIGDSDGCLPGSWTATFLIFLKINSIIVTKEVFEYHTPKLCTLQEAVK